MAVNGKPSPLATSSSLQTGVHDYYRTGGQPGSTKPVVILSHGATDDGLCWTPLARALEADCDVIMPDARGHGLSEAPAKGYNAEDRAADLAGLIQALGINRPAIGGHSMGGSTSLYAAALYPGLVGRLILEDPGIRSGTAAVDPVETAARAKRMSENIVAQKKMTRDELIAHGRRSNPGWSDEELGPWADSKDRFSLASGKATRLPEKLSWQEALAKVTCPTLLITADVAKGAIVTPEMVAEAQRILPTIAIVHLAGAGHNVRREAFAAYTEAVRTFLVAD